MHQTSSGHKLAFKSVFMCPYRAMHAFLCSADGAGKRMTSGNHHAVDMHCWISIISSLRPTVPTQYADISVLNNDQKAEISETAASILLHTSIVKTDISQHLLCTIVPARTFCQRGNSVSASFTIPWLAQDTKHQRTALVKTRTRKLHD